MTKTNRKASCRSLDRKGTVAALFAFLMFPLIALLALFVDYGYLLYIRTDMQRAADQAVLAAVQDLVPDENGDQDLAAVRELVREYITLNLGDSFKVADSDIEIGRYNPEEIYSSVELLNDGILDTVRVTVRKDGSDNRSVALFFARIFQTDSHDITATSAAVLQRARFFPPGTEVFPFAIPSDQWELTDVGGEFSLYGDGRIEDGAGNEIPGNWGTVDIGPTSNGTNELVNQILNGLSQNDLNSLHSQGVIPDPAHIDAAQLPLTLNADPGFSGGVQRGVSEVHGQTKVAPIFDPSSVRGNGNNASFDIIGWGVIEINDSNFQGSQNSFINVTKTFLYDGSMVPNPDLTDTSNSVDGAFTSPVLIQ